MRHLFSVLRVAPALLCSALFAAAPPPAPEVAILPSGHVPDMEARCTDGSVLKVKLLHGGLTMKTRFGMARIPMEKIQSIDLATRIHPAISARVEKAIERLGHDNHDVRTGAEAELAKYKLLAYPALLKREDSPDLEIRMRVRRLLGAIREYASEDDLQVRYTDTVRTKDSTFSGTLQDKVLVVFSRPIGEARLKITDLRVVRRPGVEDATLVKAADAPATMTALQGQLGKSFRFKVTGTTIGTVYGTDVYTTDSSFAAAAVHAGVVQAGKTAVVTVRVLPPRGNFISSARNGVRTNPWTGNWGAFEFVKKR